MNPEWNTVTEACIPEAELTRLAHLRTRSDIRVRLANGVAWVTWTKSRDDVTAALRPCGNVQFYRSAQGRRTPLGSRLPTSVAPPTGEERPLPSILVPAAPVLAPPTALNFAGVTVRLVRGDVPQQATALMCDLEQLLPFAEGATTAELAAVSGLVSGTRAVLFGDKLPSLVGALRFHGKDLFSPLGFRLEPELPAAVVRAAVGAEGPDAVFLTEGGFELLPRDRAEPLTRAGLRLALAGASA